MFEVEILRNIRESFGGDEALVFWQTATHLGDAGLVWIALGLFLLCFPGFRRVGSTIGIALFSGFLICNVLLKPMVDRLRPCELHAEDLLMACPTDPSFPSGHTTASFAAAVAFGIFHPKWGLGLLTLAGTSSCIGPVTSPSAYWSALFQPPLPLLLPSRSSRRIACALT